MRWLCPGAPTLEFLSTAAAAEKPADNTRCAWADCNRRFSEHWGDRLHCTDPPYYGRTWLAQLPDFDDPRLMVITESHHRELVWLDEPRYVIPDGVKAPRFDRVTGKRVGVVAVKTENVCSHGFTVGPDAECSVRERDQLRAQVAAVTTERDATRTQLADLQQSAAGIANTATLTIERLTAENVDLHDRIKRTTSDDYHATERERKALWHATYNAKIIAIGDSSAEYAHKHAVASADLAHGPLVKP